MQVDEDVGSTYDSVSQMLDGELEELAKNIQGASLDRSNFSRSSSTYRKSEILRTKILENNMQTRNQSPSVNVGSKHEVLLLQLQILDFDKIWINHYINYNKNEIL